MTQESRLLQRFLGSGVPGSYDRHLATLRIWAQWTQLSGPDPPPVGAWTWTGRRIPQPPPRWPEDSPASGLRGPPAPPARARPICPTPRPNSPPHPASDRGRRGRSLLPSWTTRRLAGGERDDGWGGGGACGGAAEDARDPGYAPCSAPTPSLPSTSPPAAPPPPPTSLPTRATRPDASSVRWVRNTKKMVEMTYV